jgi:hypothetical protein
MYTVITILEGLSMAKYAEGQEKKEKRIVPTFTPSERERYIAACVRAGHSRFSTHLHDMAMRWTEEIEASKA